MTRRCIPRYMKQVITSAWTPNAARNYIPVSYTHLDVYKRQRQKYPGLYARSCRSTDPTGDGRNFSVYLRCELETYGDIALELYYDWVDQARRAEMNCSLTMLSHMVLDSGFKSLDEAEAFWAKESGVDPEE